MMENTVIVVLIGQGMVEVAAPSATNTVIIDIQAIRNGQPLPSLTAAHWDQLRQELPHVHAELSGYDYKYECDNCGTRYASLADMLPLTDVHERVSAGEAVPVGECPDCHAVVHPILDDWYPVPESAVKRLGLQSRYYLAAGTLPVAHWYGMDRLLALLKSQGDLSQYEGKPVQVGQTGFMAHWIKDDPTPRVLITHMPDTEVLEM